MNIKSTILAFLDWKDLSGYELKKYFSKLDFIPWAGNNNQIYTALISLEKDGLVSKNVIHSENKPLKKIFSITKEGNDSLKENLLISIENPEIINEFLIRIALSEILDKEEIINLIDSYQQKIELELKSTCEKEKRREINPNRSDREAFIWDMLWENRINFYKNELNWLVKLRNGITNKL
ncbi:MAG: PadR family transcriptional regulator [Clostridiales bacterium]